MRCLMKGDQMVFLKKWAPELLDIVLVNIEQINATSNAMTQQTYWKTSRGRSDVLPIEVQKRCLGFGSIAWAEHGGTERKLLDLYLKFLSWRTGDTGPRSTEGLSISLTGAVAGEFPPDIPTIEEHLQSNVAKHVSRLEVNLAEGGMKKPTKFEKNPPGSPKLVISEPKIGASVKGEAEATGSDVALAEAEPEVDVPKQEIVVAKMKRSSNRSQQVKPVSNKKRRF